MTRSLDRSRVRAICFDIDGTIVDTDDSYVLRIARWLGPLTPFLPDGDTHAAARRWVLRAESPMNAAIALLDRLQLDQVLGPVLDGLHRLRGETGREAISLVPGARQVLERLSVDYPLCVVTAREQSSALSIIKSHDLQGYFKCIVTARSARRAKPHPAPILWAADQLGVAPAGLLMVGDTSVDILAGRAAGSQTAALLCGFGQREELERAGADVILDGPLQLLDLLLDGN